MKYAAGIAAAAAAVCTLTACTTDSGAAGPPSASTSRYVEAEWITDETETPDPGATLARAAIEGSVDGQRFDLIEFTKTCTRSGDRDKVTFDASTQGYGYVDYNTGVGEGNFRIELAGLNAGAPSVKSATITWVTGPDTNVSVSVSGPGNEATGEPPTGSAVATMQAPDTYIVTGNAPDQLNPPLTRTFTAQATCGEPIPLSMPR